MRKKEMIKSYISIEIHITDSKLILMIKNLIQLTFLNL